LKKLEIELSNLQKIEELKALKEFKIELSEN
jgi:hypothetical protein